jgi:hypothetical protein
LFLFWTKNLGEKKSAMKEPQYKVVKNLSLSSLEDRDEKQECVFI